MEQEVMYKAMAKKMFDENKKEWEPKEESESQAKSETSELVAGLMDSMAETDAVLADLKADAAAIKKKYGDLLTVRYEEIDGLAEKEDLLAKETEAVLQRAEKILGKSRLSKSRRDNNPNSSASDEVEYFKSKADRIIYSLVELDGEARAKSLGITKAHFRSKVTASGWRDGLVKVIHPDICHHPKAALAVAILNGLYGQMKCTAK